MELKTSPPELMNTFWVGDSMGGGLGASVDLAIVRRLQQGAKYAGYFGITIQTMFTQPPVHSPSLNPIIGPFIFTSWVHIV